MSRAVPFLAAGLAAAVIATPILAQRAGGGGGNRPSRQCMQEVVKLCGRDRSQIPACLQSKADQLSSKCQGEVQQRMQQRRQQRGGAEGPPQARAPKASRTVFFGSDKRQVIDVFEPADAVEDLPLILFVHGGGWRMGDNKYVQEKPAHFNRNEIYFASTGYRLFPDVTVEEQATDVGAAVQALVGQASAIGFDKDRIVLMGHSAGAHLAALVAADPQYAGEAFSAIKGVVLLDGGGYDIAATMEQAEQRQKRLYTDIFSDDPERHRALSPLTYVGGKDAPNWLALYVEEREITRTQAQALANALVASGVKASAVPIAGTNHSRMTREMGTEAGKAQTEAVDAFLAMVVGSEAGG